MKKNFSFLITLFFLLSFISVKSQISPFGELTFSTTKNVTPRLGIGLQYLYNINDGLHLGGLVGYRQSLTTDNFAGQIPLMALGRYYVNVSEYGFYPQLSLGLVYSFFRTKILNQTFSSSNTNFAYNLGLGYKIDQSVDISAHFESILSDIANVNYFVIRVSYSLP